MTGNDCGIGENCGDGVKTAETGERNVCLLKAVDHDVRSVQDVKLLEMMTSILYMLVQLI